MVLYYENYVLMEPFKYYVDLYRHINRVVFSISESTVIEVSSSWWICFCYIFYSKGKANFTIY